MDFDISILSYFLFYVDGNSIHQGTGFFIMKNEQLYLVTAAHNFFSSSLNQSKTTSFYIRLFRQDIGQNDFFIIENNPIDKKEGADKLDINFYKVDIPNCYDINIVELNRINAPVSIISYGYSVIENDEEGSQEYIKNIKPTEFQGENIYDYSKPITYYENNQIDFDNYVAKYKTATLGHGASGSPVFSEIVCNGFKCFEFAGLLHMKNEQQKYATILRSEKIQELVEGL